MEIPRYGEITAAGAALETSLSVEEAERMLSRLVSALMGERDAPPLAVWRSAKEGERHDNKTDAPSTGAARDPGGCCVGG